MKWVLPLVMFNVLLLAGCDDVKAPRSLGRDKLDPRDYPRNVSVDPELEKALVCGPANVNEGSKDQPMSVSQPIRNLKDYPLNLQYQFVFMDRTGRPIEGSGGWKFVKLESRVERFLEGAALDTNATDWRLNVRAAR